MDYQHAHSVSTGMEKVLDRYTQVHTCTAKWSPRRVACVKRRKTATAAVLVAELWVRTPSIGRTGMSIPVDEVARSAAPNSPCLGAFLKCVFVKFQ